MVFCTRMHDQVGTPHFIDAHPITSKSGKTNTLSFSDDNLNGKRGTKVYLSSVLCLAMANGLV